MQKGFQEGEWEFTFPNEDKYVGNYRAHVSGLAWRQGHGTYTTHDGQVYEGDWKEDKLNESENVQITYQNKDQFAGRIHKYKYNGPGTYSFSNGSRLTCNFANNKPSGDIIYIDHHDQLWYGVAEAEHAILNREHVFFGELNPNLGKGLPKRLPSASVEASESAEDPCGSCQVDWKQFEPVVFGKSFQTPSDVDFEDSDWFREFADFVETRRVVLNKLETEGTSSLSDAEKAWYKTYLKSAKILQERKEKKPKRTGPDLLRHYLEETLKDTCPPTSVFYPRRFGEEDGEDDSTDG